MDAYNKQQANPIYNGQMVAQPTAGQTNAANSFLDFSSGTGLGAVGSALQTGQSLTGQGATGVNNAISGLSNFANKDLTASNITNASAYANSGYAGGLVDAASRDITRNLYENQLTGLANKSAATGNINGSRSAVTSGVLQRGAADRVGDISAQIRQQLFSQGLSASQQDNAQQSQALSNAGQLSSGLTNSGINATNSAWSGLGANTNTYNTANQNVTANSQAPIDDILARIAYYNDQVWSPVNNLSNVVTPIADTFKTTNTNSTTTKTPSTLSTIGGLLGAVKSIMGGR